MKDDGEKKPLLSRRAALGSFAGAVAASAGCRPEPKGEMPRALPVLHLSPDAGQMLPAGQGTPGQEVALYVQDRGAWKDRIMFLKPQYAANQTRFMDELREEIRSLEFIRPPAICDALLNALAQWQHFAGADKITRFPAAQAKALAEFRAGLTDEQHERLDSVVAKLVTLNHGAVDEFCKEAPRAQPVHAGGLS